MLGNGSREKPIGPPKGPSKGTGRGGKRPGAGRKAEDGATGMIRINVSLTPEQREKFRNLGGSLWLRGKINEVDSDD